MERSSIIKKAHLEAENFLKNEKQFHLGALPTEQSNPKTRNLDKIFASDTSKGVETLLSVDKDVQKMAQGILKGKDFESMVNVCVKAINEGKKIVFSGCGATGRLSILLESMWRNYFHQLEKKYSETYRKVKKFENQVFSIMTGGDYALIRSVEYFEDYTVFGKQQVKEMGITKGDVLIAITEGGETSSVLGTIEESADRGALVFLMFNNPANILIKHVERSKKAIEDPRVTVLDLYCGPMAIAGSTRMQATTSEQLIGGAALESVLRILLESELTKDELEMLGIVEDIDYASAFNRLLDELLDPVNLRNIAEYIDLERNIYQKNGLITYFANNYLLDIFTDTTERAPTFLLPPFKKFDDTVALPSWAFVKNPLFPTIKTWEYIFGRPVRCLDWGSDLYREMGAPEALASNPPQLDKTQIIKFHIGNENDESRYSKTPNLAVNFLGSSEFIDDDYESYNRAFQRCSSNFQNKITLVIGKGDANVDFRIDCSPVNSVLNLMGHMAVKLFLNTVSTGTMVLMGRVTSNWMSWVEVSNKKLRDRGIRLIAELCGISYEDSCYALHESLEEMKTIDFSGKEKPSPVQFTIKKINGHQDV